MVEKEKYNYKAQEEEESGRDDNSWITRDQKKQGNTHTHFGAELAFFHAWTRTPYIISSFETPWLTHITDHSSETQRSLRSSLEA